MPSINKSRTRDQVMLSLAMQSDHIEDSISNLSKLFPEFSIEWLEGVEANYKSFLDYCSGAVKAHLENKKSK